MLQAIGALLGFQSVFGIPVPINLFTAAWNFFGIYIAPTAQFADVINELIDAAFAIIIDAVGDIPVFGNAVQQLAAWLIEIRDALWPLVDTVFLLIDTLSGQPGTEPDDVMLGLFGQIIDFLLTTPQVLLDVTTAVVDLLVSTPQVMLNLLNGLIAMLIESPQLLIDLTQKIVETINSVPIFLDMLLNGILQMLISVPNYLYELLNALINLIITVPEVLGVLLTGIIDLLVNTPTALLQTLEALVGLLIISPQILLQLAEALLSTNEFTAGIAEFILGSDSFLQDLADGIADLLNIDMSQFLTFESPLNADYLFNVVAPDLLPQIPISSIGDAIRNLVTDPTFLNPDTFSGFGAWFHDATQGHAGMGSARTLADGSTKELLGNLIPVSEGQVMPISGWAKWSSLAGSGLPIALAVTGYIPGGATDQKRVAERAPSPTTTDWTFLSGSYTVPPNVTSIRVRLIVSALATAGTVWFDDLSATKTQALFQRFIQGTDPGTTLTDDIEGLFSGVTSNAMALINKANLADFNGLVSTIEGQVQAGFEDVGNRMESFLDNVSPLNADNINAGNIADEFVSGVNAINDNIVTKLLNIVGSGFSHSAVAEALRHQSLVDTETSARLAQLENTFTGGITEGDDFERTSSSGLGSGWLTYYQGGAGTWATPNGHDASWITSGVQDREFFSIRNTGQIRSATDLQYVAKVLGSNATRFYDPVLGTYNYCGHNDVLLRVSDATTGWANLTCIRVRFGGDGSMAIERWVNGVRTVLNSMPKDSMEPPGPGSLIWGTAGIPGTARYFQGGVGTSTFLIINEIGTASGVGAAYKRWGHGGRAEGHVLPFPGQEKPASCHQWTAKDQLS